jgi:hypothetical protein
VARSAGSRGVRRSTFSTLELTCVMKQALLVRAKGRLITVWEQPLRLLTTADACTGSTFLGLAASS